MEKYNIQIKRSAIKEIESIPQKSDRQRILQRIHQLSEDPRPAGSIRLSGNEKYRIRQGNYRILYSIHNQELIVYVVKIAHRKDVYRSL